MKILNSIVLCSLLLLNTCYGQDTSSVKKTNHSGYIFVSAGMGIPLGSFCSYEGPNPRTIYGALDNFNLAGEARTGFSLQAGAGYMFNKNIGVATHFYTSSFKVAEKTFEELFGNNFLFNTSFEENYVSELWNAKGVIIGPNAQLPLGKVTLGLRIMGGIQVGRSPEVRVSFTRTDDSGYYYYEEINQPQLTNTAFVFNEGVDVKIKVIKNFNILFSTDYLTGKHTYNDTLSFTFIEQYAGSDYTRSETKDFNYSKRFSFLSITTGLLFSFQ
ncbi:MAG: hypothetical protein ABIT08_16045 [Bacteroidia bacterium]